MTEDPNEPTIERMADMIRDALGMANAPFDEVIAVCERVRRDRANVESARDRFLIRAEKARIEADHHPDADRRSYCEGQAAAWRVAAHEVGAG